MMIPLSIELYGALHVLRMIVQRGEGVQKMKSILLNELCYPEEQRMPAQRSLEKMVNVFIVDIAPTWKMGK